MASALNFSGDEEVSVSVSQELEHKREVLATIETFIARNGKAPKRQDIQPLVSIQERVLMHTIDLLKREGFLLQKFDKTLWLTSRQLVELY